MMARLAGAFLLISFATVAQQPAAPVSPVPEIPFDSVPNPLKLPPGLTSARFRALR